MNEPHTRAECHDTAEKFLDRMEESSTKWPKRSRTIQSLGDLLYRTYLKGVKDGENEMKTLIFDLLRRNV